MATPIRWDNVNGPSLSEASRPLELARASFGDAFAGLNGVVREREAIDAANWQNQRTNNTNSFLDAVARYGSADALKSAQASGELDQLRASFGQQIDANAIRGAADQRLTTLQQQAKAGIEFENVMRNERTAPLVDTLRTALMSGNKAQEQAARAGLVAAGYRDFAAQDQFADQWNRMQIERGQADQGFGLKMREGEQSITNMKDALRHTRVMESQGQQRIGIENARLAIDKETAQMNREDRAALRLAQTIKADKDARNAAYETTVKDSPLDLGTINTTAGKEALMKALKTTGASQDQVEDLLYNLNKRFSKGAIVGLDGKKNPILADVPVSVVLDAFNGATENPFAAILPGWSRRGDDAANLIENRMRTDKSLQLAIAAVEEAQENRKKSIPIAELRQSIAASQGNGRVTNPFANPEEAKRMQDLRDRAAKVYKDTKFGNPNF